MQTQSAIQLRSSLESGDLGWIIAQHGLVYTNQFGWDTSFELVVADILLEFFRNYQPERDRMWLAEQEGQRLGTIFLEHKSSEEAKLRLLLVLPEARGVGLGTRLVAECLGFARQVGYKRVSLWTMDRLVAARKIYKRAGFELIESEPVFQFGHHMQSEIWRADLTA